MLSPATHHHPTRRRFGLTEVMLIAGILAFGALTLFGEGGQTLSALFGS
jgi:hypothetical protein